MLQQSSYADVINLLNSKFQADEFVSQLNYLTEELYKKDVDVAEKIRLLIPSPKNDKLIEILQKNHINMSDLISIQTVLQDLKEAVLSIPIVEITMPFEPNEEDLLELNTWFTVNIQSKVFPKIKVNERLIGGAAISFKGVYKEYTIMKTLQEMSDAGEFKMFLKK